MAKKTRRRSPGDGGLSKRKSDGLWVGSVEIPSADGKRRQKRVFSMDYRDAKKKLDQLREDVAAGRIAMTERTLLVDWLHNWLGIKKAAVSQSTYSYYEEAVRLHIVPNLPNPKVRLRWFTAQDARDMLAKITTTANARRAHKTLKLALKAATNDGAVARNVMEAVDTPGHVKRMRGVLDADGARAALKAAIAFDTSLDESSSHPRLATRWAAGMLTGARPAELRGLEWNRVDLDNAVIDVSWQLQKLTKEHGCLDAQGTPTCERTRPSYCPQARWNLPPGREVRECYKSLLWTHTKTDSSVRVIPIVAPLLEMLKIHARQTAGQPNPHGLVWHWPDGRPISPTDENEMWHEFLKASGLPRIEQYAATRHTASTLLQQLGVPDDTRMQITGHSTLAAHRAYIHVDQTQTREALEQLEQLLLG